MNTAVINIKTEPKTKAEAQKVAKELGISLSAIINGLLKQVIRTKSVTFEAGHEIPNKQTILDIKQAEEDYKKGNASPAFKTGEEAIAWLDKQGI